MTISRDRDHGIFFECDGKRCPNMLITETDDFFEAKDELISFGWQMKKLGSEWMHFCPDCSEAAKAELKTIAAKLMKGAQP